MKPFIKKKTREFILQLLIAKPELKDNDEKLVSNIIYQFLLLAKIDPHNFSAWQLLQMYSENKLPTVDYITRVRRKIQETNIELRGEKYYARQSKSKKIANEITTKKGVEKL